MGLIKTIELDNGIITNYHRIVSLNKITNVANIIEVASYTSKAKRNNEIEAMQNQESMDVFIDTTYISKEYDADETITDAYDYLKTLDEFKNAQDV